MGPTRPTCLLAAILAAALASACTNGASGGPPAARTTGAPTATPAAAVAVRPGEPVSVHRPDIHLDLSAPAGAIPTGELIITTPAAGAVPSQVHAAAEINSTGGDQLLAPARISFAVPATLAPNAVIGFYDPRVRRWLPLPTRHQAGRLSASTTHFTLFGWFDDLRWTLGELAGNRAAPPTCDPARKPPSWLRQLITTQGSDAQLLACAESDHGALLVKVVNNRAIATTLTLSAAPDRITPSWPGGVADVLLAMRQPIAADSDRDVLLPPLGEVTFRYGEPATATVIRGTVRYDASSLLATVISEAFDHLDVNLPLAGGGSLAAASSNCLLAVTSVPGRLLEVTDAGRAAALVASVSGCLDTVVRTEMRNLTLDVGGGRRVIDATKTARYRALGLAGKVLSAYAVVKYGQEVMDLLLDQRPDIANGVDLALDLVPPRAVVSTNGYGALRIGMSEAAALRSAPAALQPEQTVGPCRSYRDTTGGGDYSKHLGIVVDAATGRLIGIYPPAGARTDRGLHVGSSAAQVTATYRDRPVAPTYSQAGQVLLVQGTDTGHVIGFGLGETGSTVLYLTVGTKDFASGSEICV